MSPAPEDGIDTATINILTPDEARIHIENGHLDLLPHAHGLIYADYDKNAEQALRDANLPFIIRNIPDGGSELSICVEPSYHKKVMEIVEKFNAVKQYEFECSCQLNDVISDNNLRNFDNDYRLTRLIDRNLLGNTPPKNQLSM